MKNTKRISISSFLALAGALWFHSSSLFAQEVSDYKISPLDILVVNVFDELKLSGELRVSATGEITFYLLGNIKVAGYTVSEVQEQLKKKLGDDYLVDPQVIVQVKEHAKRKVNVTGEVNRPGQVDMPDEQPLTILDAIAVAGGTTRLANESSVEVTRDGQQTTIKVNLKKLRKNPNLNKQFTLEPGDSISVPQSRF
jgi:polysaccharide export outer membrane protein